MNHCTPVETNVRANTVGDETNDDVPRYYPSYLDVLTCSREASYNSSFQLGSGIHRRITTSHDEPSPSGRYVVLPSSAFVNGSPLSFSCGPTENVFVCGAHSTLVANT